MEDNKLIAEFMGLKNHLKNQGVTKVLIDGDEHIQDWECYDVERDMIMTPIEMKYHTSWDWLMPVIEKIESLGYSFEKNYQPIDNDWQCLIVKGHDIIYQSFNDDGLKSSYDVVVEFIKNYSNES